jgi:hypothetical protein
LRPKKTDKVEFVACPVNLVNLVPKTSQVQA